MSAAPDVAPTISGESHGSKKEVSEIHATPPRQEAPLGPS
jgi:hypothetical protein